MTPLKPVNSIPRSLFVHHAADITLSTLSSPSRTRKVPRKSSEIIRKANSSPIYEFGSFLLDTAEQQLLRDGKAVPLTPKVYEVLRLLVQNSGHMLGKNELLQAIWPDSFVEEGNLTRNISTLRAALGENSNNNRYIETVPKRGYRFVADVRELKNESAESLVRETTTAHIVGEEVGVGRQGAVETKDEPTIRQGELPNSAGRREYIFSKRNSHMRTVLLGLATLAVAVAAVVYYSYLGNSSGEIQSVAVLPFVNVDGDPNLEYLSEGIPDSIINSLSSLSNLRVMSLSSVSSYKRRQHDPKAVGSELNVQAVLISKFSQQGEVLSISTELVDVGDNRRLWGEQYNRKLSDILVVQDEIAREISEKLRLRLSLEEKKQLAKQHTKNAEAYLLYQQGREHFRKRTRAAMEESIKYLEEAIRKDPAYALARVQLAYAYGDPSSPLPSNERRQKIESLLLKALELDNDLAEAHALLGGIRLDEGDWPAAERECKRALDLDPNSFMAHGFYASYLQWMRRHDEAVAEWKRAQALEPLAVRAYADVGYALYFARRYDEAIEQLKKTIDMDPKFAPAHARLGAVYLQKKMHQEAILEFEKARALDNSPERPGRFAWPAYAYAVSGQRNKALGMLAELKELAKQRSIPPISFAIIYTGLGEKDQAFAWLEKVHEEGNGGALGEVRVNPMFDSLRSDQRFANLLRRVNLAP